MANDQLFITPFAPEQIEEYNRMLQKAVGGGQASQPPVDPNQPVPGPSVPSALESREALLARFAKESGMKTEWAEKCLQDNGWSFEAAAQVFLQMKEQNLVPPDAFV